ncbi:MAG: Carbohydrate ABC transporter ATP-binding protein, CUT1 family [Methanoculleus marisnigri]|uniref:Carbohydrate ABC transporter ATP-binding protein, CUT1 family n=1 Tax=Methanoculleus marisnigri TaxID=2198 RepID=A0A101IQ68_9EURY|nr:MAG: Carbohydrate ABC transporter ATP-binding protein, CUT1 family [Methanoculleus marisnigri]
MAIIEAHDIKKSYGNLEVLHDIDLSVREGEILGLIGPSGSGKSTLLRILDLIEPANEGELSVFGIDTIADRGSWLDLRRRMGMLFQRPIVFNASVYDNVAMGLRYRRAPRDDIDRKVKDALEAVGLSRYIKSRALDLSGGEQQRVALSRVLVTDPEILFLDEPTANLDPTSTATIEAIVTRLNREANMTVVISTHDLTQGQRLAHRVGVMLEGRRPEHRPRPGRLPERRSHRGRGEGEADPLDNPPARRRSRDDRPGRRHLPAPEGTGARGGGEPLSRHGYRHRAYGPVRERDGALRVRSRRTGDREEGRDPRAS